MTPAEALPRIREALEKLGVCRLSVTGNSMLPFLHGGRDAVYLVPATARIRRGDLIFYLRSADFPVLHRVVRVRGDGSFLCTGDIQKELEPVRPSQLIAKADKAEINGKLRSLSSLPVRIFVGLWLLTRPVRPLMVRIYLFFRKRGMKNET